jgi:hypothetical protein
MAQFSGVRSPGPDKCGLRIPVEEIRSDAQLMLR